MTTNHITRNPETHLIEEIRCKLCGEIIQNLVQVGTLARQRRLKDNTVLREVSVMLAPNNLYAELEISCEDDNGITHRHVTHICKRCLPKAKADNKILLELMKLDILDQQEHEYLSPTMAKLLMARKILGVI